MNGKYYPNPTFPIADGLESPAPLEERVMQSMEDKEYMYSYTEQTDDLERIIKFNRGKKVTAYANFPNSTEPQDKKFEGVVENSIKDYLIISDPLSGKWQLIPFKYLNYLDFEEKINFE